MDSIISNYLSNLKIGKLQIFENMAVGPLFCEGMVGPAYKLLNEALDEELIVITELNPYESVSNIKVVNTSPLLILFLDGEELIGSKQNRVLNTSILLDVTSESVIPVSCTERGRWRYTSDFFSYSDAMMSHRARARKVSSVAASLSAERGYMSDQHRVWEDIDELHEESGTSSITGAMIDVYKSKTKELDEYVQAFEYVPRQKGILVFINGEPVGLETVSRMKAYAKLHMKLVKSYAMDALHQKENQFGEPSIDKAKMFYREIKECKESRFASVGLGYDYRFEGQRMVGSALVFGESVIHLAFLRLENLEKPARLQP